MATDILTSTEAAAIITDRVLPASAKPRTKRSITRLCQNGELPGAYKAYGDWCIPRKSLEAYIKKNVSAPVVARPKSKSEQRRIAIQKKETKTTKRKAKQ